MTFRLRAALLISLCCCGSTVWAGGFEFPGNGAEAMGRGGAFTAKASNPSAIDYNIAGLARIALYLS